MPRSAAAMASRAFTRRLSIWSVKAPALMLAVHDSASSSTLRRFDRTCSFVCSAAVTCSCIAAVSVSGLNGHLRREVGQRTLRVC